MIADIITALQQGDYYGGGKFIEFAKGEKELVSNWKGFKRKVKRKWHSRKK